MNIILTSFVRSSTFKGYKYSVARWQPKGYNYPSLDFLSAVDLLGRPLRLKNFSVNPIAIYRLEWLRGLYRDKTRYQAFLNWLTLLNHMSPRSPDIILCCWCPYSQSTQNQIKIHGTFACHTGLIGQVIQNHNTNEKIKVIIDDDRKNMLVELWKPYS